jgi:hypothetical protein
MEINMVKHTVMWNVRGEPPRQKKESAMLVKTAFESLSGKIPGLTRLEVGRDVSAVDYACDVYMQVSVALGALKYGGSLYLKPAASRPRLRVRLRSIRGVPR